ncbi:glycosyltransferase family 1 protein [Raineyella sp. LH-20]|uniref:glycosyltransferase family 4 protein n=1 Tax=Raineyella sp. LH-20 TaxID=3081204 RepID=UPI002953C129|nr:glycosyltransferase family 1 protein [Raineyella sp. LH-20]WOP17216.1 glycosyltransferase family 1 protein [Raineyella sp. LH-20]
MPRLSIATLATEAPMGAQVYQEEIASRAAAALDALAPDWAVERLIARSLRSPLAGNRRLPMGWLTHASPAARRALGRVVYRPDAVVHRMNLELPPPPGPDVITLHDVVAWKYSDESAPVAAAAEEARRADAVICVSRFTAQEAVELLGIRDPYVVHNGVDPRFFDPTPLDRTTLATLGVSGSYVLTAGGASRRKNLEGLAAAWPAVHSARPDLTLVLSGPDHPRRTALFGHLTGVRSVGRVAAELVPGLMAAASAVVVPSLYEGFGLPALEGMAAGVPVVAARTSSLPEVVGDSGVLVDPTPDELAAGILWATSDDPAIAALVAAGRRRSRRFTWEASAAGHAEVWAAVSR